MGRERGWLNEILAKALHPQRPEPEYSLDFEEQGRLFIGLLNLRTVVERMGEHHWLVTSAAQEGESFFQDCVAQSRRRELRPLADVEALFEPGLAGHFKSASRHLKARSQELARQTGTMNEENYRQFVGAAAQEMWALSEFERDWRPQRQRIADARRARLELLGDDADWRLARPTLEESVLPEGLFRAFDLMDDVFQLQYERDLLMDFDADTTERIFENSGAGVQTSYATAMVALREANLRPGDTLVDLGSGYGRVGILGGILRPDLNFEGYEFVRHRVECAQSCSERAGLSARVRFRCQDLGDSRFEIPAAAAYYLYDPFNEETYRRVLRRIHAVASRQSVIVITNADAGAWFQKFMTPARWRDPEVHDGGTLRIFRSCS